MNNKKICTKIADHSEDFKQGLEKLINLLNIPAKLDDNTSNLQAVSKLICEKFNSTTLNTILSKPLEKVYFVLISFLF
jgi:hypothetical protein